MKLLSWKLLSSKLLSEKLLSKKFASGQLPPRTPLRVSLAFTLSLGNFHLARLPGTAPDTHQLPSRTLLQAQDPGALPRRASGQLPPRPPPPRTLLQAQDPGASPGRASGQLPPRPPLHVSSSKHSTLELHLRSKFAITTTDPRGQPGTAPDTHQLRPRTVLQAQDLRAPLGRASAQTRPRTPEGSRAQYRTPINYLHVPCYRHRRGGNSKIWPM